MKFGEVCEIVRGSSPRPKSDPRFYRGPVPRFMGSDLKRDGKVVFAGTDSLTELVAMQSRPMKKGEVVIAVSGAPGLPAILAHDACIHDGCVGRRNLDQRRLNEDVLFAYLIFVKATSSSRAVGAIFKNLTTDQIRSIEVPDLPLSEQKRIAEILDRAEALRGKRRAALTLLDELTQSIFLDMFGDPIENPFNFPVKKMIDIVDSNRPISYGILRPGPDQSTGVKLMPVIIPPAKQQDSFTQQIAGIEQLKVDFRQSMAELDQLFSSLQHRTFRGEL